MRRAAKIDENQNKIVAGLRKIGATVQSLAAIGKGCPDLLVGYRGVNYIIEIKDGGKPPSAQRLTADQVEWHESWRGAVSVANSLDQCISIIGAPCHHLQTPS